MEEVVATRRGGPEVLELRTRELVRDLRKALVRVTAAGVGSADREMLFGRFYAQPEFPFVSGYDLVGTVVGGALAGKLVAAMPRGGSWATEVQVDPRQLVVLPDGTDPAKAVALITDGVTAWRMVHRVATVRAGQTVLVHGASGGVGRLLVQLARQAGASVVGTASAGRLTEVEALGAVALDYRKPVQLDADVVFDHIGGRHLVDSYRMLKPGGTLVSYGSKADGDASGSPLRPFLVIIARLLGWEARRLTGLGRGRKTRLFNVKFDAAFPADLNAVLRADLDVPVTEYRLDDAKTALADFLDRRVTGKAVLVP
ncbi:zinc-binding dehydrogenase [Actinokineospora auranticolor]|uniref:NADPH:quinone reductase-like Zn-dependent oxidoreductase n=1 Tax=Actinokineospora auranticolor TaxID=155976 RepID=A0A2S6GWU3_9PSEU|nr:zinc-binding dehydrogenase [Actinokineospora auranticolor]PPK69668.1 NADPH:quinone reductase-like Zn-dependent oxidoreductase [Actinokineospora auranticolor]